MEDDPPYHISVTNASSHAVDDDTILIRAVYATLRQHGATSARIHVALVSDRQIAELNERHLQHPGSTDVLTFDMSDDDDTDAAGPTGEVVVSVETAAREAKHRGHPVESELALYAVHGTLHLLGHDDRDDSQAAAMHALEDRILATVGLGTVYESGGE